MRTLNMIDMTSASDHLTRENGRKTQNLGDIQSLCLPPRRVGGQGWSFRGDWKRSVAPRFFAK